MERERRMNDRTFERKREKMIKNPRNSQFFTRPSAERERKKSEREKETEAVFSLSLETGLRPDDQSVGMLSPVHLLMDRRAQYFSSFRRPMAVVAGLPFAVAFVRSSYRDL